MVRDTYPGEAMGFRTALVADDCALTREVHADLLRSIGFAVTVVGSGNAAADEVRRAIATHNRIYELTLLDFDMPDGDGPSTARQIRSAQSGLWAAPLLCVTSHRLDRVKPACLAAGFDAVLSKPFRIETVTPWLRDVTAG
jgi:CheY-like chemotaxis protein